MAITFVGSLAGTHASAATQNVLFSALRNEAGVAPTLAQNDVVLIGLEISSDNVDLAASALTPTGYTAAHTDLYYVDTSDTNYLASYKVMGATPDTSVDIPAAWVNGSSVAQGVAYTIHVLRGVNTTTPLDVTPTTAGGSNIGRPDGPAITPVTAGAWIMVFGGSANTSGADFIPGADLSTTTNHFRTATIISPTNDATAGAGIYTGWTSGAFDPIAWTGGSGANTASWAAVTLALRPASGGITEGTAAAAGSASTSGVSGATAGSAGAATGIAALNGVSGATAGTVGASAGIATTAGSGAALWLANGAAAGVATITGVSGNVSGSVGAAAGAATTSALVTYGFASVGAASGVATPLGVSGAVMGSAGSAAGLGAVTGLSGAVWGSIGAATGIAASAGLSGRVSGGIGSAAGIGMALGEASSTRVPGREFYNAEIAQRSYSFGTAVRIAASPSSDRSAASVRAARTVTSRR